MRRVTLILLVLLIVPAHAETAARPEFEARLASGVYAAALGFMAPRILEQVPVPQLTIWGLRGLTALDPDLSIAVSGGALVLGQRDRILLARPLPQGDAPASWAAAAADLAAAAWLVSPATRHAGADGVIQSFFDELFNHLDPYSRYIGPVDAEEDRDRRTGQAGLGLTLARRGASVVVVEAVPDGPGAIAGIRVGDRIVAVDGEPARGGDLDAVADAISGEEGSPVSIDWRGHDGRRHSSTLERATVPPETVFPERLGSVLLIRVTSFSRRTDQRFARGIDHALSGPTPIEGIVLDLRGNRGGLLREAVTAADMLLPEGVVTITAGRDPEASRVWRSVGGTLARGIPLVVMVDGRTASAAEILAAALADRGRAVIVGSTTLGKGLVQTIAQLPNGGELFVTWSRVLAPLGWPLQGLGVLPQVCTSLGRRELDREFVDLAAGRQPMAAALALHRRARAPLPAAEVLAVRSACPAAEGRDLDLAAARFLIRNPAAYASALLPPMRESLLGSPRP